jgi:hypothetical protein
MAYKLIDEPMNRCRIVGNLINVVNSKEETYIPIAKISRFTLLKTSPTNEVVYKNLVNDEKGMSFDELMGTTVWSISAVEKVLSEFYACKNPIIDIANNRVTFHPDTVHGIRFNVYAVVDTEDFVIRQFYYEVQSASDWEAAYREIVNDWFDPFINKIDAVYNHGGV